MIGIVTLAPLAALLAAVSISAAQPLVVISVDGIDNRYLATADAMGSENAHPRNMREYSTGFGNTQQGELTDKPTEIGNHGHWPRRYRPGYILWGSCIPDEVLPEFSIKDIAGRLPFVAGASV